MHRMTCLETSPGRKDALKPTKPPIQWLLGAFPAGKMAEVHQSHPTVTRLKMRAVIHLVSHTSWLRCA
jgi:hypothetical protein